MRKVQAHQHAVSGLLVGGLWGFAHQHDALLLRLPIRTEVLDFPPLTFACEYRSARGKEARSAGNIGNKGQDY